MLDGAELFSAANGGHLRNTTFLDACILLAGLSSAALVIAHAQAKPPMSDDDNVKTMKPVGPTFQSLQKNNTAMNHADGAKDGQKLASFAGEYTVSVTKEGFQTLEQGIVEVRCHQEPDHARSDRSPPGALRSNSPDIPSLLTSGAC